LSKHELTIIGPVMAADPPARRTWVRWAQRFQITKGVASGLLYLHED
jgi:hypothetical protein